MARNQPSPRVTAIRSISRRSLFLASFGALGRLTGQSATLRFQPSADGSFSFDTGVLKGVLRNEGRSTGLIPVTHSPTGSSLATSMGLFGIYRVFGNGRRYGTGMWHVPSEARAETDGSVTVVWPAAEERPFTLAASYRWAAANTLDLTLKVTAAEDLLGFETFLASYLGPSFRSAKVLVKGGRLMAAERANGQWQMFPRNPEALKLIYDGRWKFPPNPVEWARMPDFEFPVAIRTDPGTGLTVLIMAPAHDCFAIATPEESDSHHSTYLSLFGLDLKKGATAQVRARLVVLPTPDPEQLRGLYVNWATQQRRNL
ncbi:MAG: hypothetical protein IT165_28030 [Bryobacterales bacterium]|nr:hypothetical protein [Bryobacterales bacterium]